MKRKIRMGFRRGVASFYIVAFSTLILTVVSVGFSTVILSEITRTANDDLSQSAYDSALVGVEDAKLAYANYRRCREQGAGATKPNGDGAVTCEEIVYWMQQEPDCYMVGHILGRIGELAQDEVKISDTVTMSGNVTDEMNQAYTCVKIATEQKDYRAGLSSANSNRIVALNFDNVFFDDKKVAAKDIKRARLSWYLTRADMSLYFGNTVSNDSGVRVAFQPAKSTQTVAPPTVELQLVQTAENFKLTDFDIAYDSNTQSIDKDNLKKAGGEGAVAALERGCGSGDACTDRATLYLVPMSDSGAASETDKNSYVGVWDSDKRRNDVSVNNVVKTNDRYISNKPFGVYCDENGTDEFVCSTYIELPGVIGGDRSNETFMFVVNLPYGQPDTEFAMEFYVGDDNYNNPVLIRDAQVTVDSTGRANDLVRRIETRLETSDTSFAYPMYALQLLGEGSGASLKKDMTVTSECNYYDNEDGNNKGERCN